jgi:hypothetical protein
MGKRLAGHEESSHRSALQYNELYKHFYFEGQEEVWRNEEGKGKKRSINQA